MSESEGILEKIKNFFGGEKQLEVYASNEGLKRRVMLIDEADLFFDPAFYGNLYCPSISLKSPEVSALLKRVWK